MEDKRRRRKKRRRRGRRGLSRTSGIILVMLQFVLSVVLTVNLLLFDVLPAMYILALAGVLVLLLGITLCTQLGTKGRGIGGKIFCVFLCVILGTGSFYIGKINNALGRIAGKTTQTNTMAVTVLKNNKAQKIADAASYRFGVQYAVDKEDTESAVNQIEKEVGGGIKTTEYSGIPEEVQALYDGSVEAVIYNTSQESIIKARYPSFAEDTRQIYTFKLVTAIENDSTDASMKEAFAVYLSGNDEYGELGESGRSDVNIIAVVNPKIHQVLLVTTPRDYYVPIPGVSGGQRDKLTHAGNYGINTSMATLGALYDIEIPFYGRVNFTSMMKIVDELGGLDVESDEEFDTGWESGAEIHVNKGANHFNGEQALAFCRERHALEDGDNARGRHQQAVITAMIKKMMSPSMLRAATGIIDSVSNGVDTNLTAGQIRSLIKTQLRTNAKWNIRSVAAEGTEDKQPCYSFGSTRLSVVVPDENSVTNITELINKVERGESIEEPATE